MSHDARPPEQQPRLASSLMQEGVSVLQIGDRTIATKVRSQARAQKVRPERMMGQSEACEEGVGGEDGFAWERSQACGNSATVQELTFLEAMGCLRVWVELCFVPWRPPCRPHVPTTWPSSVAF